jgi:hypothetical protein
MTPADPLFTALSTAITPGGSLTSPLQYKGSIAVNTSFPLIASVAAGWMYHITADVTDNAGATYTNTNVAFLAGDEIVWDGSAWIKTGSTLVSPLQYKGTIATPAGFPTIASVKSGFLYKVTATTADTGGATYTNTSLTFKENEVIMWNGSTWVVMGGKVNFNVTAVSPVVLEANDSINIVDTATLGAACAVALPAASAAMAGRKITIGDGSGDCVAHNITITPNTTDCIDGVNSPVVINRNYYIITLMCLAPGYWVTVSQSKSEANTMVDRGAITINTDFPASTYLLRGYSYRVLADVIDNGGAGYTNTGGVFTEGDHIMWDGVSAWVVLGKAYTMVEKGAISLATHFPLVAFVKRGYVYRVTGNVTDNAGVTYTNSLQTFVAGDCIVWNGTNWTIIGNSGGRVFNNIHTQAVAATATVTQFIAPAAGRIIGVYAKSDVTAETTESMTFDVHIDAQTTLTGDISIAAAQTTVPVAGVIDTGSSHNVFAAGQVITIIRTYTAGSGTPAMVATHVSIFAELT